MASTFRSFNSYFHDLQDRRRGEGGGPKTGGPLTLDLQVDNGGLRYNPGTGAPNPVSMPASPQRPPTPSFGGFTQGGLFQDNGTLGERRGLASAVGGAQRQEPSQTLSGTPVSYNGQIGGSQEQQSPYTSSYTPSAGAPPTGGPLTYQPPQTPQTGGPLTYEPQPTGGPLTLASQAAPMAAPQPTPQPQPVAETAPAVAPALPQAAQPRSIIGYEAPGEVNDFYARLINPISSQLESGYGALGGAVEDFYSQIPDIQTWGDVGGDELLRAALGSSGPERLAAEQQLKDILGTQYTGPEGLDLGAVEDLYGINAQLNPYASGALGTISGASSLLEGLDPSLTPGMRREEALRLMEDPEYRKLASQLGRETSRLSATTGEEVSGAMSAAEEQRAAAKALREAATGAFEGESGAIEADIASRQEEARANREALEKAYGEYKSTGDLGALEAYGITPEMFQNELTQLDTEAKAAKEEVIGRPEFEKIKDVPLMEKGITGSGREAFVFPETWFEENKGNYSKAEMAEIKKLARQRQKALDDAGFARHTVHQPGGKYSGVESLYFGGDQFDPGTPEAYISLQNLEPATRHNLATEAQREDFNWINEMLGKADRLQEAEPYEAAKVVADAEGYLDNLEKQYEEAFGKIKEVSEQFEHMRNGIRKKYRKGHSTMSKVAHSLDWTGLGGLLSGVAMGSAGIAGIE